MKINLTILLIITCSFITSCNRVLLPKKSRVLYHQDGYLLDKSDELLFVPMDATQNFFNYLNNKRAYKIAKSRDSRHSMYYALSDTIMLNIHYNTDSTPKDTFSIEESVYITKVRVTYAPFEHRRIPDKDYKMEIEHQGRLYQIVNYNFFEGEIYRINVLDSLGNIADQAFD